MGKHGRSFFNISIEPYKQLKFAFYLIVSSVTFIVVSAFIFYESYIAQFKNLLASFPELELDAFGIEIIKNVFFSNALTLFALFAGMLFTHIAITLYLTHKYYGPLVSIRRFVKHIAKGNFDARVTIRKGDELQELVRDLNKMAECLKKRYAKTPKEQK